MSKEIPLTQGAVTIVDDADYDWLNQWAWRLNNGYVVHRCNNARIYMHRLILEAPLNMETDHINRDGLDNRRANLRLCTHAQNAMNATKWRKKCSSRYKGVTWNKKLGCWRAQIYKDYVNHHLGRFEIEEDAARAYNEAARELHGEFASLNEEVLCS